MAPAFRTFDNDNGPGHCNWIFVVLFMLQLALNGFIKRAAGIPVKDEFPGASTFTKEENIPPLRPYTDP